MLMLPLVRSGVKVVVAMAGSGVAMPHSSVGIGSASTAGSSMAISARFPRGRSGVGAHV